MEKGGKNSPTASGPAHSLSEITQSVTTFAHKCFPRYSTPRLSCRPQIKLRITSVNKRARQESKTMLPLWVNTHYTPRFYGDAPLPAGLTQTEVNGLPVVRNGGKVRKTEHTHTLHSTHTLPPLAPPAADRGRSRNIPGRGERRRGPVNTGPTCPEPLAEDAVENYSWVLHFQLAPLPHPPPNMGPSEAAPRAGVWGLPDLSVWKTAVDPFNTHFHASL